MLAMVEPAAIDLPSLLARVAAVDIRLARTDKPGTRTRA